jgi:hypothetical protein
MSACRSRNPATHVFCVKSSDGSSFTTVRDSLVLGEYVKMSVGTDRGCFPDDAPSIRLLIAFRGQPDNDDSERQDSASTDAVLKYTIYFQKTGHKSKWKAADEKDIQTVKDMNINAQIEVGVRS